MAKAKEGGSQPPVPKEAPPGLFFTKAAFLKYSALAKVREASAARKRDQSSLPRPLGPLPGSLVRAAQSKAEGGPNQRIEDAKPAETQDAVVPELQSPDVALSEELASEDIWGDEDADTGMEDESARPMADSMQGAAPAPETAAEHGTRSATRKRQAAAPAKNNKAPKRQRGQPKGPQGGKKSTPAAKPAAKAAASKGMTAMKARPARKPSKGPGTVTAEQSEPNEASETPSEMQAAKAEFMRTMGLPEPKAFTSGSKSTANRPVQRLQPAAAQKRAKHDHKAGAPQPDPGKGPSRQTLQQHVPDGTMQVAHQQAQPLGDVEEAPAAAAAPPFALRRHQLKDTAKPGDIAKPVDAQQEEAPQESAAAALTEPVPTSASLEMASPQALARASADREAQPASLAHDLDLAPDQGPAAGAAATAGDNDAAAALNQGHTIAGEAACGQLGGGTVPTSPGAPKPAQLLGGSGRPAENGVKLVNLLNPNNPQYDQAFALEYARMKAAAGKDEGKGHRRQKSKRIYSNLTAKDHAWYLAKQGVRLHGRDAERMADLCEKMAEEQQQFIRAQWLDAQDAERFRYMDPRVEAQLQAHFQPMREAVRQLPRLWQLHGELPLAAALQGTKQAPAMAHLSTPVSSGQPPSIGQPSGHTAIPLDRDYMFLGTGSSAPSRWLHEDKVALQLAAEKRAAVVMADGAFAELAQTAVQGFAAGWEIPVAVSPPSSNGDSQPTPQSAVVVLSSPLLKRALPRREKHELLFAAALSALGRDKSLKQQQAQGGDWRKQVLDELGASAGARQGQELQDLVSGLPERDNAATRGSVAAPKAAASGQPALRYALWRLGEHRIITRAQVHAAVQSSPSTEHSTATVVQAKMEYHGNKASDAEEVTAEELVRWWSAAHVRPGSHTLVGHVGVHSCQVLRSQLYTAPELLESAAGAGFKPAMTWRLMSAVLGQLTGLAPGQYLLTHQPGADAICLFAATSAAEQAPEAGAPPLPCMTDAPEGTVFDLWSAHAQSGATDESQLGFIPKMWQPTSPDMPQIPYTFTPRPNPVRRKGRKGDPKGTAAGAGQILDWDTKAQNVGGGDADFSATKYAELLREDF